MCSVKLKFFDNVKSTRRFAGPSIMPRGAVPTTFGIPELMFGGNKPTGIGGLGVKHEMSNHCCCVCAPFALGLQMIVGRPPATNAGIMPSPAGSNADVTTVKGRPV